MLICLFVAIIVLCRIKKSAKPNIDIDGKNIKKGKHIEVAQMSPSMINVDNQVSPARNIIVMQEEYQGNMMKQISYYLDGANNHHNNNEKNLGEGSINSNNNIETYDRESVTENDGISTVHYEDEGKIKGENPENNIGQVNDEAIAHEFGANQKDLHHLTNGNIRPNKFKTSY